MVSGIRFTIFGLITQSFWRKRSIVKNHGRYSLGMENLDHIMQIYQNSLSDESTTSIRPKDILEATEEEEENEGVE